MPNPSLNRTRYGRRRKPGRRQSYYRRRPGLRHLPPRSGLTRTLGIAGEAAWRSVGGGSRGKRLSPVFKRGARASDTAFRHLEDRARSHRRGEGG